MNSLDEDRGRLMAVRPSYLRAIEAAGGVPLLIHLTDDLSVVRQLYECCDGMLLPGGDDVDPAEFGEEPHPQLGDVDKQRDAVELAIARWCRDERKPLFGICRGLQMINVAFGGSLYQDIPSQVPNTHDHRENTHLKQREHLAHAIAVNPESWLAAQLETTSVMTNTMHHQAIKDVGQNLRVTAVSDDGIIEAIEGDGELGFVAAVQCHPEHLFARSEPRWAKVFAAFINHCRV